MSALPGTAHIGVSRLVPQAVSAQDERWMRRALALADQAARAGEVPVGAVLVHEGVEIGCGWNCPISATDPSAHAEINALRAGARTLGNYRLPGSVLYVTVEPCVMCAGAIVQARVSRLVFGAREPRTGAVCSVFDVFGAGKLNHQPLCEEGVLAAEASAKLRAFFRERRRVALASGGA